MKFTDYKTFRTALGGKLLELEIGKVCEQTNGQVMVKYGDTVVNVTVVASKEPLTGHRLLSTELQLRREKMYAAGKIPGGFKARRKTFRLRCPRFQIDGQTLASLVPQRGYYNDVQVVATVMSLDLDAPSEIAAMIGSSVALAISDIPWDGPTGSLLIGMVDGEFVVNPSLAQRRSELHLVVSGTKDAVLDGRSGRK